MTGKKKVKYSNARMKQGLQKIADEIGDWEFDYIVGVIRGGAVPAIYLSHMMQKPVYFLPWSNRDNMLSHGNNLSFQVMSDLNKGKKILIVEDIIDHGITLKALFDEWKKRNTRMDGIRTCSLFYYPHNKGRIRADYYHIEHNPAHWVVFPWEI